MPIYEYACKNCDHALDALQKMSDDPLVDCPECGEPALRKLLSAPRFRLKGEGGAPRNPWDLKIRIQREKLCQYRPIEGL